MVTIIKDVSKVVAAVAILQLSTKCPKWLGYYTSKKVANDGIVRGLTTTNIKFNVAWNICWREAAEIGVLFLIPFFLGDDTLDEIPVSAIIGIAIGLAGRHKSAPGKVVSICLKERTFYCNKQKIKSII